MQWPLITRKRHDLVVAAFAKCLDEAHVELRKLHANQADEGLSDDQPSISLSDAIDRCYSKMKINPDFWSQIATDGPIPSFFVWDDASEQTNKKDDNEH